MMARMTTSKERITVSLPADLVESARAAVGLGEARDVSDYVADAMARKRAKDRNREALGQLFASLDAEPGPEHDAWARRVLGIGDERAAA